MALLVASIGIELLLYAVPILWRARRYVLVGPVVLTASSSTALLVAGMNGFWAVVWAIGMFRLFNQLRIAEGRMHERYLLKATRRTGLVLAAAQIAVVLVARQVDLELGTFAAGLAVVQLLTALGLLTSTAWNIRKTTYRSGDTNYADRDLPTVTIAIPARNETPELEACLHAVLANDYPKLEVLVLDDCSQDKTPEIIKSFAQRGVRFIKGTEPEGQWLAKNHAYDRLADEANGEFILFCGVDVRFGPRTVRALVTAALSRDKDMVSVLPLRITSTMSSSFIQSMRYWWELAPPRKLFNRPPVLSTCWLIRRKRLKELGGLEAVRHAIIPEGYFAREIVKAGDKYSFLRAGEPLDVQTRKSVADQYQTALRTRYPQIRRRPEMALLLTFVQLLLLLGPFWLLPAALLTGYAVIATISGVALVCLVLTHMMIVRVSDPANSSLALVDFPLAAVAEMVIGFTSMYKYEFSDVDWKGRNICMPVMHATPRLPRQD